MSVTAISPTSVSPPASIGHSYTNSLPPIQTLPTWTRSKFDKLLRNVPPNDSGRKRAADLYSRYGQGFKKLYLDKYQTDVCGEGQDILDII